jgi:SIR2-like domain
VSFDAFARAPIVDLIEAAGAGGKVSLLVGAGASMEAGLPSWDALLDRLLVRGIRASNLVGFEADAAEQEAATQRWLADAARDGPLGKAALAEALAEGELKDWIKEELFAPAAGPQEYFPGPISREIPFLQAALGDQLRVMTLNYDDLIEQAFRDHPGAPEPYATSGDDHHVPDGKCEIMHLHGYLGRDDRPQGQIILSEADYMHMQHQSAWQEAMVQAALMDSTFVFVGTSLLDPNLIRYLHGVAAPSSTQSRFAIFVRQGTYTQDVGSSFRGARERALSKRWEALGVRAVFVDHYTDVAQVLAEVARRRTLGSNYVPLPQRADEWIRTVKSQILGCDNESRFFESQRAVNELLVDALSRAVSEAQKLMGGPDWHETLQLALWMVDETGGTLTNWVMTDRLHIQRETIEPIAIDEYSNWVAVRSYCRGTSLADARDVYASRWKFVRGTPLVVHHERYGRIPVGCLTTASLSSRTETQLDQMPSEVLTAFNDALCETVLTLLEEPFAESA